MGPMSRTGDLTTKISSLLTMDFSDEMILLLTGYAVRDTYLYTHCFYWYLIFLSIWWKLSNMICMYSSLKIQTRKIEIRSITYLINDAAAIFCVAMFSSSCKLSKLGVNVSCLYRLYNLNIKIFQPFCKEPNIYIEITRHWMRQFRH